MPQIPRAAEPSPNRFPNSAAAQPRGDAAPPARTATRGRLGAPRANTTADRVREREVDKLANGAPQADNRSSPAPRAAATWRLPTDPPAV